MNLKTNATRPYRKTLAHRVRTGQTTLRVFGQKGSWHIGAETGKGIVSLNGARRHTTKSKAIEFGKAKFNLVAKEYRSRAA